MNKLHSLTKFLLPLAILCLSATIASATELEHVVEVQKYNRAIHIMAMLLAGGVAIGSTCDLASFPQAFIIGILAGVLSTFGFVVLQGKIEKILKGVDTCGVMNLHGMPGLLGGLAAIFIADGINPGSQLTGIGVTILVAAVSGFIAGKVIAVLGRRTAPYDDAEEFELKPEFASRK